MEMLIPMIWFVIAILRSVMRERGSVSIKQRPRTLCRSCANVHMVRGFSGKELISCTFGGTLRPMKFEVRECTGFANRLVNITPMRVAGFIRKENEVYAEVRIA